MIEQRTALNRESNFMTRDADGDRYVEGYFAVFGSEYRMWDKGIETIAREAFDETLSDDIRALVNHDSALVLGRTFANTLTLRTDDHGLWGSIRINPADQDAVNLYERVRRGDVSQCSFGFDIIDQDMETLPDGVTRWTLRKVKLYEVSVVTFPAYEDTAVQARQKDLADLREHKTQQWRADMMARLKGENNGTENPDAAPQH